MSLCHLTCRIGLGAAMPFGDGIRQLRDSVKRESIHRIYQYAQQGIPEDEIFALCV
jgi:hypothetical protein